MRTHNNTLFVIKYEKTLLLVILYFMIIHKLFVPLPSLHPLFCITLAYIFGICYAANLSNFLLSCLCIIFLTHLSWLCSRSTTHFYMLTIGLSISFFTGQFLFYSQKQQFHSWNHQLVEPVDIIATITDITACASKNYRFITTARIDKIHASNYANKTPWQKATYSLIVYSQKKPCPLVQDQIFLSSVNISPPKRESWHKYALKNNIGGTLFCDKLQYNLIARPHWSIKRWLWSVRQSFYERLLQKMSNTTATFYSLLFMGKFYQNKKNSESMRSIFQLWGVLHYLARSGLHLVIFVMIWNFLLLAIPCSRKIRESLLLILSCIYFLLSWPSLSFVRAFTTYIFYKTSSIYARSSNTLHILTLVTLLFLLVNPTHLFCLDFQLSFGLTFALAWLQNTNFVWKNSCVNP